MNFTRARKVLYCLSILAIASALCAEPTVPKKDASNFTVVSQLNISNTVCTGCSLYNMLANGRPEFQKIAKSLPGESPEGRVRHLIDKYGAGPSAVYPNRARYSDKTGGLAAEDMHGFVNDCLKEFRQKPLATDYLDRKDGESPAQHLRRIHALLLKSLKAGVPPIINVRSYVANTNKEGDDFHWNGLSGHSVTLLDIDPDLRDSDKGFRFWYAESDNGKEKGSVESAYASLEETRPFAAPREFTVSPADNKEKWVWKPNSPFLVVTAPSLSLRTHKEPGHKRTLITLRHAVYAE